LGDYFVCDNNAGHSSDVIIIEFFFRVFVVSTLTGTTKILISVTKNDSNDDSIYSKFPDLSDDNGRRGGGGAMTVMKIAHQCH
jgi:hypothetical protein